MSDGTELNPAATDAEATTGGTAPAAEYELDDELVIQEDDATEDEEGAEDDTEEDDDAETGDEVPTKKEEKPDTDPKSFTKRINKKHSDFMAEKQRADNLQSRLDAAQATQNETARPEIPPVPDPFAENFEELILKRDLALQSATAYDAKQNFITQQQQDAATEKKNTELAALQDTVRTYSERAAKLGISPQQLDLAGRTVQSFGISDQVTHFILNDEKGPAITHFLARNPAEVEAIGILGPMAAAVYITNTILPQMIPAKRKKLAPAPADTLGGGAGSPTKRRGAVGTTYT